MLSKGILLSFAMISALLFTIVPARSISPARSRSTLRYIPKLESSEVLPEPYPDPNATATQVPENIWYNSVAFNVVVAADEEELTRTYWTPGGTVDWHDYVENRLVKVGIEMVSRFGIFPTAIMYVTWHSDKSLVEDMLYEMVDEVGWDCGDSYDGYIGHVLLGITGQNLQDQYGQGYYGIADDAISATIVHWEQVYWKDDNLMQHELSHMFYAEDHEDSTDPHYYSDCVMSYKSEWVGLYAEDGWIWIVNHYVEKAFLSNNYCSDCNTAVTYYRYRYCYVDNSHSWGGGNKWNPIFPE